MGRSFLYATMPFQRAASWKTYSQNPSLWDWSRSDYKYAKHTPPTLAPMGLYNQQNSKLEFEPEHEKISRKSFLVDCEISIVFFFFGKKYESNKKNSKTIFDWDMAIQF